MNKRESNICKCIAIICMYIHHLFYSLDYFNPEQIKYGFILKTADDWIAFAQYGKICVAIFAFVSGYGTAKTYIHKKIVTNKQQKEYAIGSYIKLLLSF